MLRTPPEDMYFFDEDELDKLGNQSITTKDKQEFAKIDQFLNSLYAKLEIISCRENASSCSDESLCKYASKDKAWLSNQEAADYVREALNRNLSCGVPEAQCPEDLRNVMMHMFVLKQQNLILTYLLGKIMNSLMKQRCVAYHVMYKK